MIETERLRMRPLSEEDVDPLHRDLFSDPGVTWDGSTFTREEARESLEAKRHGFGLLAITDRSTGEFLGWGGLQLMDGGPEVELGSDLHTAPNC